MIATHPNPLLLLSLAAALSMSSIPLLWRLAPRLGLVDMPDPRKVHAQPVPRVGGWGITLGALAPLLLSLPLDPLLQSYVGGCLILFLFGVWDDAREISHWPKFIGQLLAVGAVVWHGDLYITRLPFLDAAVPAWFGQPFTVFALVGVINAINHSDGLDGLAGGESLLSLIALAILGYLAGSELVMAVALSMVGGILGFLRYNSHPARVFMGDCGSQVLGFSLGFLVVYLTQRGNTAVGAALPALLLGMPVPDILSVLYQRVSEGMNWFRATRNHVHHRLLSLGFDHYEAVVIIYSLQAILVLAGVLLRYGSDLAVSLTYVAAVGGAFLTLTLAERHQWRLVRSRGDTSMLARTLRSLRANPRLRTAPLLLVALATPALMLLGSMWAGSVPHDFSLAAMALAAVVCVQLMFRRFAETLLARLAVYATALFSVYLSVHFPGVMPRPIAALNLVMMILLAVAIAIYIRFTADRRFRTTPSDYLTVLGMLALLVFGTFDANSRVVVELVFYAAVLMYGSEVLFDLDRTVYRKLLQLGTLGTLLVIAVRGAF